MKIGIYTITEGENYGNRLQNYALQKVLIDRKNNVKTLKTSQSRDSLVGEIKLLIKKYKRYLKSFDAISRDAALGDMNNRLTDLAEEFKIKNLVNYDFDFESEAKINFNEVDKILKGKQKEFSDYLDNSLNG
ncbi:hypothetical protein [uncultured Eubacterium sp.]|jgi:hypothetical protein|uniref:hypothetical protein n=1 Tax=Eubacterium sp. TaxID=142586 RepID=UPI0026078CA6|nr:hypothetical protein [uncultured Eubacterium sp.]